MKGRFGSGGSTDRFSSSVIDDENGLIQVKSLNHFDSPLVEFFCSGGLCAEGRKYGRWKSPKDGSFGRYFDAPDSSPAVAESGVEDDENITNNKATKITMVTSAVLRWGIIFCCGQTAHEAQMRLSG